jgi:hypothetical protein
MDWLRSPRSSVFQGGESQGMGLKAQAQESLQRSSGPSAAGSPAGMCLKGGLGISLWEQFLLMGI